MSLKQIIRDLFHSLGYDLIHASKDPILMESKQIIDRLRLCPEDDLKWADNLSLPAAHSCIRSMLKSHAVDLVLDIGANRGQFAQQLRHLGYTKDIVSFEPLSSCRSQLEALVSDDKNWQLVPTAVGAKTEILDLHVFSDDTFSSVHAINQTAKNRFGSMVKESRIERVPVCRLDDCWSGASTSRANRVMLKTDTQGHDLEVLQGASEVLQHTYAIVIETALDSLYDNAPLFPQLVEYMTGQGFSLSGFSPISHHPKNLKLIEADCVFTRNEAPLTTR